jgi:pimeloyl-ACP methyl ester carboxylesterase
MHRRQIRYETKRLANGRIAWKYDPRIVNGMGPTELWDYVPALYVVGGRSRLVTAEEQQQLRTLPFAEVVTIPDAGHYPQEDTPEAFLAIVRAFLAG